MVTLPAEFVAIKYPGYFWNTKELTLYSIKMLGVLRPVKRQNATFFNKFRVGYQVSHHGRTRFIDFGELMHLPLKNSIIPVKQN
jgi:hypothetical protein